MSTKKKISEKASKKSLTKETGFEKCIIYMLTNNINDDTYIGSSVRTQKERFAQHIQDSYRYPKRKVYKSFVKVGRDNVNMDILEKLSCHNEYELLARERYWTDKYKPNLNTCKINKVSYDEETLETTVHTEFLKKTTEKKTSEREDKERAKVKQDIKGMTSKETMDYFNKMRDETHQMMGSFGSLNVSKSKHKK